jgi:hypothetical protein
MNRNTIFQLQAAKLKEVNLNAWQECQGLLNAPIKDLNLLPDVLEMIIQYYDIKPENYTRIISVVYFLFAPYKLYSSDIRMPNGIRKTICKVIGWNHSTSVNESGANALAYWKGARFREEIKTVAEEIQQEIISRK